MSARWRPSTMLEQALFDARQAGDQQTYIALLSRAELSLPVREDGPMTSTVGDRTFVLVYTSPGTLRAAFGGVGVPIRLQTLLDLWAEWPDPDWWLAVNPGTPIEAQLPASYLARLADASPTRAPDPAPSQVGALVPPEPLPVPRQMPDFRPANEAEEALLAAVDDGDADAVLKALLLAELVVPVPDGVSPDLSPTSAEFRWRMYRSEGETCVPVFTSATRCGEVLGPVPTTLAEGIAVVHSWPDPSLTLALNPGTPIGASLPGAQVAELAAWAADIGLVDILREVEQPAGTRPSTVSRSRSPGLRATPRRPASPPVPRQPGPAPPQPEPPQPEPSQLEPPQREPPQRDPTQRDPSQPPVPAQTARQAASRHDTPAADARHRGSMVLQKLLPHQQVGHYLQRGYDLVSGLVHPAADLAAPAELPMLYAALALDHPGSGFVPTDQVAHLLRWVDHVPVVQLAPAVPGQVRQVRLAGVRLPHGAELWCLDRSGAAALMAWYDADVGAWRPAEGGDGP